MQAQLCDPPRPGGRRRVGPEVEEGDRLKMKVKGRPPVGDSA